MSSSPEHVTQSAVLVGDAADAIASFAFATRELRSGAWTRLGGSTVLGDDVTEHTLSGLVSQTSAAARSQGYATGWAEGRRAAQEQARQAALAVAEAQARDTARRETEHRAAVDGLVRAAARLDAAVTETCAWLEERTSEVALTLTETLVAHELAVSVTPGADAVRRALALAPGVPLVRVRLCAEDAAEPALRAVAGAGTVVVADRALRRGDAVVETDDGVLDARISSALDRVREVLAP